MSDLDAKILSKKAHLGVVGLYTTAALAVSAVLWNFPTIFTASQALTLETAFCG